MSTSPNTVKMTAPAGSPFHDVRAAHIHHVANVDEPSTFDFTILVDIDEYDDDTDLQNVCQVNSLVEWTRGTKVYTFYVISKELTKDKGKYSISVACLDPIGKLQSTMASIDGNKLFTLTSPDLTISEVPLVEMDADMGDIKWRFYPERGSAPWLPALLSNSSTLSSTIGDSDETIILGDTHAGLAPVGYVQIEDEWIQYDGYDFGEADAYYRIKNCYRGALGSIAAAHSGTSTVYQRISQRVHPSQAVIVQGYHVASSTWEYISTDAFSVQVAEGSFDFTYDISAYGDPKWNAFRASYAVFDEDHANTITISGVFSGVLTDTILNGGPEVPGANIDLDGLENLRITRVRIDKPVNTFDFMINLLDEVGLMKGADEDYIGLWFNHPDYKVTCKPIVQKEVADHYFGKVQRIDREISLEDLYGAVLVEYEAGFNNNLVTFDRMWHPQVGDSCGSNAKEVKHIRYSDDLYANFASTWKDNAGAGHNNFTDRLCDAQKDTGWGLSFKSNPGTGVNGLWCYFSNPATSYTVDTVKVICDFRRNSGETDPIYFKVMGVETFDIVTPTDSTGIVDISGNLVKLFEKGKGTEGYSVVEMEVENVGMDLQGILLRWDGLPTGDSAADRYCMVREIKVLGHKTKTVLVQLTDDHTKGSKFMYAPLQYAKLFNALLKQPRVKTIKLGGSTYNAAVSLGRLALLQTLVYDSTRLYLNRSTFDDLPAIGDTVQTGDGYQGVVIALEYTYGDNQPEQLAFRLIDFGSSLIT